MTLPQLYAWAASGGFPACLALGLWLLMSGRIRFSREIEKSEKDNAADRADWDRQMADLRTEYAKREADLQLQLEQMRADRNRWEDKSWSLMERWTGDLETGQAVTSSVAGRVIGRGGQ